MGNYEIREFYGKEQIPYKKLSAIMFRRGIEDLKDEAAYAEKLEEADSKRSEDFMRLGAFYDDVFYAAIESIPYMVRFDGHLCKMSGIGGVISDFNAPVKGAMKEIYKEAFIRMRKKGQYISHLFGFEENYYRQYGYDTSCREMIWHIPIDKLRIMKEGIIKPFDNSEKMKQEICTIREKFSADQNLYIQKSEKDWECFFENRHAYTQKILSFVHYSPEGVADAFMSYSTSANENRPQDMVTKELWFTNLSGLRGVLSYFATQRAYCDYLKITLPEHVDLSLITDSCGGWGKRDAYAENRHHGTTRIVDVEEILKIASYRGRGKICIRICDDIYAPWNNDCFTVEFGEKTTVTRGGTPDIEMNINAFSSGILGKTDFENLLLLPEVKVLRDAEFDKVFYKKKLFMEEHF